MIDIRRYEKLKGDVDRLQRDVSRSEGALQQQMIRLKSDYDCDGVKEAEAELKRLKGELDDKEQKFKKELVEFETEWGEVLKG